jgi:hypothetical protein
MTLLVTGALALAFMAGVWLVTSGDQPWPGD